MAKPKVDFSKKRIILDQSIHIKLASLFYKNSWQIQRFITYFIL